jgi:hypothetical protein
VTAFIGFVACSAFGQYSIELVATNQNMSSMVLGNNGYVGYVEARNGVKLYQNGTTSSFLPVPNSDDVYLTAVNGSGVIVGSSNANSIHPIMGSQSLATYWSGGNYGIVSAPSTNNWATGISDAGMIVGNSLSTSGSVTYGFGWSHKISTGQTWSESNPGIWNQSSYSSVSSDGFWSAGYKATGGSGSAKGYLSSAFGTRVYPAATGYQSASIQDVTSNLNSLLVSSKSNNFGDFTTTEVVEFGSSRVAIPGFGGRYTTGQFINELGTVAGSATDADGFSIPFVWTSSTGTQSLKPFLFLSGYSSGQIRGLNDQGQILMEVFRGWQDPRQLILLSPSSVPEPFTVVGLLVGCVSILSRRTKRKITAS